MQGLLRKVADLDSDAERGIRLIEFFDQLVVHGADLEAIVRATAVLAEGTAGAIVGRHGTACAVDADGELQEPCGPSEDAIVAEVRLEGGDIGRVWVERPGAKRDWDDLIVDRMALTVAASQSRSKHTTTPSPLGLSNPAIVQVLLDEDATEVDRSRAVRLLGFSPGQLVDVIALSARTDMHQAMTNIRAEMAHATGRHVAGTALSSTLGALIVASGPLGDGILGKDVLACIGDPMPVEESSKAWRSARQGVRFASLAVRQNVVRVSDLGCFLLLSELPPGIVAANRDVVAMSELASLRDGGADIQLLRTLCVSGSERETAKALHMHHSSVAYRLSRVSTVLRFNVRLPESRDRLGLALLLWGLHAGPVGAARSGASERNVGA
ncbi:helix-turn-helix domain-containing protein [Micromonospora sp. NPDC048830]|uniref:helix-turn-helix domain-containing protein n=1 Tax=Micromonospora sp. NPDC048830 TaxID=3364257 RepID=UPI003720D4E7